MYHFTRVGVEIEDERTEEDWLAEEAAPEIAEKEKAIWQAVMEAASQRIAQLEAQGKVNAEMKALQDAKKRRAFLIL